MTSIQVVVRCRERNPREVAAKLQSVIELLLNEYSISTPTVTVNTARNANISSRILNSTDSKTYQVDQVYGPLADQELVFTRAINPIFREFINGYNVTVLAYGQTGTGKTYTMSGKVSDTNQLTKESGVIPRILDALFRVLNENDEDFVVKVSFIELYNENLKDLLNEESSNLKIFENNSGITISNLKEVVINDLNSGFNNLKIGLQKRKVASTKLNDLSSRSHTIFTISLFKKSNNDLVKFSKINLVDLAGSENINKSGSINQRAKEAGSINQSLLTLGRVINCLGDSKVNTSHIPYRESKLTRLLQDSIGGKTKTLLISTISPARINLEETLSTLEYSVKVKSIKNKPQLGQDFTIMMKEALLKDLSSEIIRLNNDLISTRQKNGIFLNEANYNDLMAENMSSRNEVDELKRKLAYLLDKVKSYEAQLKLKEDAEDKFNQELKCLKNHEDIITNKLTRFNSNVEESLRIIEELVHRESPVDLSVINQLDDTVKMFQLTFNTSIKKIDDNLLALMNELPGNLRNLVDEIKSINNGNLQAFQASYQQKTAQLSSTNKEFEEHLKSYFKVINLPKLIDRFYDNHVDQRLQQLQSEMEAMVQKQFKEIKHLQLNSINKFSNDLLNNVSKDLGETYSKASTTNKRTLDEVNDNFVDFNGKLNNALTNNENLITKLSMNFETNLTNIRLPLGELKHNASDSRLQELVPSVKHTMEVQEEFNKENTQRLKEVHDVLRTSPASPSKRGAKLGPPVLLPTSLSRLNSPKKRKVVP